MKIAVCIKQVPTREWQPRLDETGAWIREQDVPYEMNEPDAYALEEALRLRETHGGEVVVCSAGPARVQQVLREALARGADRAIHVEDDRPGSRADGLPGLNGSHKAHADEKISARFPAPRGWRAAAPVAPDNRRCRNQVPMHACARYPQLAK